MNRMKRGIPASDPESSHSFVVWVAWIGVVVSLGFPGNLRCHAQDTPGDAIGEEASQRADPPSTPTKPGRRVSETGLRTYYVRDSNGELVPVPNMSYEDFLRLYELDRKLTNPEKPPKYSLDRMQLRAVVEGDRAAITATFTVRFLTDGIVRIPLRLPGAILVEPAEYTGEGEHVLQSADDNGGYDCWLSGSAHGSHTIRLQLLASVNQVGRESRLKLGLPRATSSSLQLIVPEKRKLATITAPAKLTEQKSLDDGGTEFNFVGLAGDTQVAWSETESNVQQRPLLVEAMGTIRVRVKGPGAVTTEARIRLTSYGRKMQSVRIRMPKGSKPIAVENPNYSTEFVAPAEDAARSGDSPLAIIRFAEPTAGPIDVQLAAEQTRPSGESDAPLDVLGFEVIDAMRHFGVVAIAATGDWLVRWDDNVPLHRMGSVPDELLQENLVAAFEYYQQPSSLPIRIQAKQTRVGVEPTYFFDVTSTVVRLEAIFKFRVRGAAASFLRLDLDGWEVTDISDRNLIGEVVVPTTDVTPLEIPLQPPRRGDFQLRIKAEHAIDITHASLRLSLPSIRNAVASQPIVVVAPADNLNLTGDPETMSLFDPEPLPENLSLPNRDRNPFSYRYRGELDHSELVYDIGLKERTITVRSESLVRVATNQTGVEQRLNLSVRHRPMDRVQLIVPRSLMGNPSLRILIDGEQVDDSRISRYPVATSMEELTHGESTSPRPLETVDAAVDDRPVAERWDIPLGLARTGDINVVIKFTLPFEAAHDVRSLVIPTIRSADGAVDHAGLTIDAPVGLAVSVSESSDWIVDEFTQVSSSNTRRFRANQLPQAIELSARTIAVAPSTPTVAERTFIQTWLTKNMRQDRAVYQLSTVGGPLRIRLPDGITINESHVAVDGKRVSTSVDTDGWLVVNLPSPTGDLVTLELSYRYSGRPTVGRMRFDFPVIEGVDWNRQLFWQLIVPAREHLIAYPDELGVADRWQRHGLTFQRQPDRDQRWLETWCSATRQPFPETSNVYLTSGFGEIPSVRVTTLDRRWLLLGASGVSLCLGLVWRQAGWRIHPLWLASFGIAWLVAGWFYPAPTIIVAQAAAFGCSLVLGARLVDWWFTDASPMRRDSTLPTIAPPNRSAPSSVGSSRIGDYQSTEAKPVTLAAPDN